MIEITKPAQAPEILRVQGAQRRRTYCRNFDKYEAEYRAGTRTFPFDGALYGHETVKTALVIAQHGKCCFCESKIGRDGDVEHFRPKAGCCQSANDPLIQPGYYWLAYEWSNLLLSCGPCNQRFKKNLFPLVNATVRAECHKDDIGREEPLFINPSKDNPQEFLSFRQEIAYPVKNNRKGLATRKALQLNRESIREKRRDRLEELVLLRNILDCKAELSVTVKGSAVLYDARQLLLKAVKDESEYAGMARAAQAKDFRL